LRYTSVKSRIIIPEIFPFVQNIWAGKMNSPATKELPDMINTLPHLTGGIQPIYFEGIETPCIEEHLRI
jgi:hypothetical protein